MEELEQVDQRLARSLIKCLKLLEQRGWNRGRLGALLGVRLETLRNWHKGEIMNPRFATVAKLHLLAGESLDAVLGEVPDDARLADYKAKDTEVRNSFLNQGILESRAKRNWQSTNSATPEKTIKPKGANSIVTATASQAKSRSKAKP